VLAKVTIDQRSLMRLHRSDEVICGDGLGGLILERKPSSGNQKEGGQRANRNPIQLE
jgi:hypothetical protein